MATKIWFCFSLLLLIYSLCILNNESNYLNFDRINEDANNTFNASFCFPLRSVLRLMDERERTQIQRNRNVFVPSLMQLATAALNKKFSIKR